MCKHGRKHGRICGYSTGPGAVVPAGEVSCPNYSSPLRINGLHKYRPKSAILPPLDLDLAHSLDTEVIQSRSKSTIKINKRLPTRNGFPSLPRRLSLRDPGFYSVFLLRNFR